ncbi:MAG: tRNA adenosine(34) deaminase TadA [Candidatus Omnitrophota bacterium]|nr:tRNA adenosine(34) deaminase TadA [Candidatus Omnitrophota bacterium]
MQIKKSDSYYMREALKEARKAFECDEVPVGAVIVYKDRIIARAHNQILKLKDPTAHAEMLAITQAADYLNSERLINCSLYVTIEPCSMCAGAGVLARIKKIIYGADDSKSGACGSILDIANNKKLNHRIKVARGVLQEDCASLLKEFFKKKRRRRSARAAESDSLLRS